MKNSSRKSSSLRNLIIGVMYQFLNLILTFACRTILIKKLGSGVLGINSLYSNILTLLSLAELGISNVMLFKLYKPIADNDEEKISAYMNYYRKIYNIIALVVLLIGLAFIPVLKYIISGDINIAHSELIIYYLLFLFNTVSSYFIVYKQNLINANQQFYILKIFNIVSLTIQSILKITFLLILPNYKIYLIIECCCNLLNNIILNFYADKKYPLLKNKKAQLTNDDKKGLMNDVKDTFLYRLGGVLITNTDSIVISVILGTLFVGYISNYNLVISSINGFIVILTSAIFASVGNMAVEKNPTKSNEIFNVVISIYHLIGAICGICMFCLFNDFILMWLNDSKYILDFWTVFALCFNFYFMTAITPIYIFRENFGLFKKAKYYLLSAAIVNIIASILLTYWLGLVGVVLGTIVCRLTTTFYLEPPYLYKKVFQKSSKDYFIRQLIMFIVSAISFVMCYFACYYIGVGIWQFIVKGLICCTIVISMFTLCFFKTKEFRYIINTIKEIFNKLKHKNSNT